MAAKPTLFLVGINCQPELEEKFNIWYNGIHIPMLLKFNGIEEVTRYKIIDETKAYPNYLAIYKFESQKASEAFEASPELAAARDELRETWKEEQSQKKWFQRRWRVHYEPIKTWKR